MAKGPQAAQNIIQRRNEKKNAEWNLSTNANHLDQNGTLLRNANYIENTKPKEKEQEHEQK